MAKVQSALYNIFLIIFIPVLICIPTLFLNNITEPKYITYPIIMTAIFSIALYIIKKIFKTRNIAVFSVSVVFLAVLLFIMQMNMFGKYPELILYGDYRAMYSGFREISSYGELTAYLEYFLAHPHQLFAALFYGVLNRIFVMLGLQGPVNVAGTIITNCILVVFGGILISFATRRVTNDAYGLFAMFVFCLFNSYWGCVLYAYTHTLSVFFVSLMIFCFAHYSKCEKFRFKLLWLFASGISFALCKSSEGITLIAFVAAIIYIIITCPNIKHFICEISTLVLSFVVTLMMITAVYNILGVIDYSQQDRYEFPLTHWIMMGQGETGEYCEDDYQATVSLESKQEKFEMHKEEIINRISSRTPIETIQFYAKKQRLAWIGGTYGASTSFPDTYAYNFTYRILLVLSILAGAVYNLFKNRKPGFISFSQIYTLGIIMFFCIWEVSPSYLFSSIPMLIICSVLSLYNIVEKITNTNKEYIYE